MVKLDRIEHFVTIPEDVTATLSEDGVVTIQGPKGTLTREFTSTFIQLLQDGSGLIVRVGSTMIDSSIKSQLSNLKNAMKEVG